MIATDRPRAPTRRIPIHPQPDDTTCGPTALHAIYRHYGDPVALDEVIATVPALKGGGTLAVHLGIHALERGYAARLYTCNLRLFDPTWFAAPEVDVAGRLDAQLRYKRSKKARLASEAYARFVRLGGDLLLEDLGPTVLRRYLDAGTPLLAGLSATLLYRSMRERPRSCRDDDLRGKPVGHFVVLVSHDAAADTVEVADPMAANPLTSDQHYDVPMERLVAALLVGVLTYDGNLLVVTPRGAS